MPPEWHGKRRLPLGRLQLPYVYEGGGGSYDSGVFTTYDGYIDSVANDYASQLSDKSDNCHVSGIGCLSTTDYPHDEDHSPAHPLAIDMPVQYVWKDGGVNYARGIGFDGQCPVAKTLAKCLVEGDIIVLNAGANTSGCNASNAKVAWVLNQISTAGEVLVDTGSQANGYFAVNAEDGSHFWPTAVWDCLHSIPYNATNYHLVKRNTAQITPYPTPIPPSGSENPKHRAISKG